MRVAVVGAGSWGTAAAVLLASKGLSIRLWARRREQAEELRERRENRLYLPGVELPPGLAVTGELEEALEGTEVVVLAVPSHGLREVARRLIPLLPAGSTVVSLTKGLEEGSLLRMSQVLEEEGLDPRRIAVLTGPCLAIEVAQGLPTACVSASVSHEVAARVQAVFSAPSFRVYTNPDVVGCELGGAVKNVIAIAAGVADGLGYGENAKAALITRGLAEMARVGVSLGGNPLTFSGLAGMGDLVATCISRKSRNRYVGEELGKGRSLQEILAGMRMVAEGVKTSRALLDLAARVGVEVPITREVVRILYEGGDPRESVASLMLRPPKAELWGVPSL